VAVALSWAVSHAKGRVTQSVRSAFTAAIYEFATHMRQGAEPVVFQLEDPVRVIEWGADPDEGHRPKLSVHGSSVAIETVSRRVAREHVPTC
jgi:hypothetical protein